MAMPAIAAASGDPPAGEAYDSGSRRVNLRARSYRSLTTRSSSCVGCGDTHCGNPAASVRG